MTLSAEQFQQQVLALRPRIAVFDCDGTLWSNNSGEDFFYWSMQPGRGLVPEKIVDWAYPRYDAYNAGQVGEDEMCGEMTTMYRGTMVANMEAAARLFFEEVVRPNIFTEMLTLTRQLTAQGCEIWAVSSTNEWVVCEGVRDFGIPPEHVLGCRVHSKDGTVTGDIVRVPSAEGKVQAIRQVIQRPVEAIFGNSVHDAAMLAIAGNAFAVNPSPDLEKVAEEHGWTVYWPENSKSSVT